VQYTCARLKGIFNAKSVHAQIAAVYGIFIWISQMTSKPVSSELTQALSFASRLFFFVNKKRLKIWLWVTLSVLLAVACIYIEIQTSLLQSWFFTRTNEQLSYQLTGARVLRSLFLVLPLSMIVGAIQSCPLFNPSLKRKDTRSCSRFTNRRRWCSSSSEESLLLTWNL